MVLLAQIESFLAVVRRGTVSRAAETLFVTQPALTARIQSLERELGSPLFARSGRGLRLTDAGRAFLPHAERVEAALRDGQQAVADVTSGRAGRLVLGAASSVSSYVLPSVLKRFRAEHPAVELIVRTSHSERILELVVEGEVELGVARALRHPEVETLPLYREVVVLATHPLHPFARRGSATLAEVGATGLILFDRTSSYYDLIHELFLGAGVTPRTVMELDNFEATKKMLEEGLGVAMLPRVSIAREVSLGQLAEVPIVDAESPYRTIAALRRSDVGPPGGIAAAFLDMIQEMKAEPGVQREDGRAR